MKVKIWGARGSLPSPYPPLALYKRIETLMAGFFEDGFTEKTDVGKFLDYHGLRQVGGYGGNTPCVEVKNETQSIIIDGGSGIRTLGYELMQGPASDGKAEIHLLFTHFHWDHIIGLPFFTPLFIPGNLIHIYAVQENVEEVFQTVFQKPYFPIPFDKLASNIRFHHLEPRKRRLINGFEVVPYQLDHPDPCWGFKISQKGRVFAHCVDTEAVRTSQKDLGPDLPLYQGSHVMLFDAQYTLMETFEKVNWGHAAAAKGLEIAMREGIPRVIFMHYDPASTDEKIAIAEKEAKRYYIQQLKIGGATAKPVDWEFAFEGMEIEI